MDWQLRHWESIYKLGRPKYFLALSCWSKQVFIFIVFSDNNVFGKISKWKSCINQLFSICTVNSYICFYNIESLNSFKCWTFWTLWHHAFKYFYLFGFLRQGLYCNPSWPWTHYSTQSGLQFQIPLASTCQVLGLQGFTTQLMSSFEMGFHATMFNLFWKYRCSILTMSI
jgi:hypothetical protein